MKTKDLTGIALDWAVAVCLGGEGLWYDTIATHWIKIDGKDRALAKSWAQSFTPSIDWAQGGPIIDREGIGLLYDAGSACRPPSWFATPDDQCTVESHEGEYFDPAFMVDESAGTRGPTPLIAAMRCFVASKLGEEVDVPPALAGE